MKRYYFSFILLLFLTAAAFRTGEGGTLFFEPLPIAIGLAGSLVTAAVFPGSLVKKALFGVGCLIIACGIYIAGLYSFNSAFRDCVHHGENARRQLAEYYARNRQYPDRLEKLEGRLPGRRITMPSILEYKKTGEGYELTFRDWLMEFKATQSDPFMECK